MHGSQFQDIDRVATATDTSSAGVGGDVRQAHRAMAVLVGVVVAVMGGGTRPQRNERGLSQSTENAILLAGAAAIALTIITVITAYVKNRLPK